VTTDTTPLYAALGLTAEEYERIQKVISREPTHTELAMFSVMWSEHCSYKSSRIHLRDLPTDAPWVVLGPGEGAGVVQVAPGVRVAFKMESHNHPSAVEPFQGAATGVGGIVRDILSLGARPIAVLDPLRFGPLSDERNRFLFDGVVRGIAAYGNSLGLPTVGGEAIFDPAYSGNPLVNAMCVGVLEDDEPLRASPSGAGDLALLIGSKTGRDGIGGASILASQEFEEGAEAKRPSVQVGDPFTEKLLIEACLELKRDGLLTGMQDLGAAGITCALSETAAAAGLGVNGNLDDVPLREGDMEAWEICMSESQERMLACVAPDRIDAAIAVCEKWGLDATVVARYSDGGRLVLKGKGQQLSDIPAASLADGPLYERPVVAADRSQLHSLDPLELSWPDPEEILMRLLASPSIASKAWIWRQYDHMVRLNALVGPGADSAVLRLPESRRGEERQPGIVLATDGPGRIGALDPYIGGALAVCESARNVACLGARPLAITNCLNFGSPERPEVMGDFAASVRGIADACRAFGIPVTGGNVSFYNESPSGAVHPTAIVGMLGVLDDAYAHRPAAAREGDAIVLLGESKPELGGSEALAVIHDMIAGRAPALDLGAEVAFSKLLSTPGLGTHAHDLAEGGLAVAVAEMCIRAGIGAQIELDEDLQLWHLFGESTARALMTCSDDDVDDVIREAEKLGVPVERVGRLQGSSIEFLNNNGSPLLVDLAEVDEVFENAIPALMER
jgi:phosphoribosylformylglycinamidine synthase subunit PurL